MARRQCDSAQYDRVADGLDGAELEALDHATDHLRHLGLRQRGSDAAPDAAAEGKPGVRLRLSVEETLRAKMLGLRVGSGS